MLIFLITIAAIIIPIIAFIYWINASTYNERAREHQRLSYKQTLLLSSMVPEKWRFASTPALGYVEYCGDPDHWWRDCTQIYMESYFDSLRLARFAKHRDKMSVNNKLQKEMAGLLKSWTEDIEKYRQENGIESIINNINKEVT